MHLPSAPDHDYCLSTPRLPEHHLIHLALACTLVVGVQVGVVAQVGVVVQVLGVEVLGVEMGRAVDETLVPVLAQQHGAPALGAASQAVALLVVVHDAPAEVEPEAPYLGYLGSATPHAIPAVEATLGDVFPHGGSPLHGWGRHAAPKHQDSYYAYQQILPLPVPGTEQGGVQPD
jgi:hypothetical protein